MKTFLRLPSPFDTELRGLRNAINASVIFSPKWMRKNYDFMRWVNKLPPPKNSWQSDFDSVLAAPKTIRNHQQSIGPVTYPGTGAESWRVELSRFTVPQKKVGIIKAYEQFLSTTTLQAVETVWSISSQWGDPRSPIGTWFFRLSPYNGNVIPWINQLNPIPTRPGIPYNDMPDENGIWFPLCSAASNNIHLVVPGGYILRLFWECDANIISPIVAGRLRGFLQSSISDESRYNIRANW